MWTDQQVCCSDCPLSASRVFPRSAITPAQRAIPKFKFAVMGLLDSVAGIMGVFAVNYINNAAMIVLLQQAAIPISMSISKMFLGATYTVSQVRKYACACGGGVYLRCTMVMRAMVSFVRRGRTAANGQVNACLLGGFLLLRQSSI